MRYLEIKIQKDVVKIPYLTFTGTGSEKHCVISGGMHGDEVNGIQLVRMFIEYCRENEIEKKLRGKLTIIPLLNPSGFRNQSRNVGYDRKDLNRSFNQKTKSASNLIANALEKEFFANADLAIDCHDSGKTHILLPHTRVHRYENKYCARCTQEMAKAFGSKIIIERKGKRGMLAVEMTKKYQLPVLTIEIGGAMRTDKKHTKQGFEGILNILKSQGFLPGEPTVTRKQYYLRDRFGITAKNTGVIKMEKKLGQRVHLGDKIGNIYVPMKAKTYELEAPMCGIIFSMHHIDMVRKGEIIYSILQDKKCHMKRRMTAGMFEEMKNIRM